MEKTSKKQAAPKASTSSSLTTIKKTSKGKQPSVLSKFNEIGAFKFLNLSSMKKNHGYLITHLSKYNSKFGERLLAELDNQSKLFLPERYNTFNDKQIAELGSGAYVLINRGKKGDIFNLELLKATSKTNRNQNHSRSSSSAEETQDQQEKVLTQTATLDENTTDIDHLENDDGGDTNENDDFMQYSQAFPTNIEFYSPVQ